MIDEQNLEELITQLRSRDYMESSVAAAQLIEFGEDVVEPLLYSPSSTKIQLRMLAGILSKMNPPPLLSLVNVFYSETGRRQRMAGNALAQIGTPAVKPMCDALYYHNPSVVREAARVLGRIKDERGIPHLIHAMEHTDSINVRAIITQSLTGFRAKAVEPVLTLLHTTEDRAVKLRSISILGRIRDERAIAPLKELQAATIGDHEIQRALNRALRALEPKPRKVATRTRKSKSMIAN